MVVKLDIKETCVMKSAVKVSMDTNVERNVLKTVPVINATKRAGNVWMAVKLTFGEAIVVRSLMSGTTQNRFNTNFIVICQQKAKVCYCTF
uniref:Uncharacterized protein n=1 Tax=Arion vulgaris TaxID=1028688 RepID=A0A0B7A0V3_9EUPU